MPVRTTTLSGRIEAGNIATAVAQSTGSGTFVTDAAGFGIVDVFYPQDHARWVHVTLEATTSVQGTEFAEASNFILPINGEDVDEESEAPPGVISPFGSSNSLPGYAIGQETESQPSGWLSPLLLRQYEEAAEPVSRRTDGGRQVRRRSPACATDAHGLCRQR